MQHDDDDRDLDELLETLALDLGLEARSLFYALDGDIVRPVSAAEAALLFGTDRTLARDQVGAHVVSTIFLVIDHARIFSSARPLLFESMIFSDAGEALECLRTSTRADALDAHRTLLARARALEVSRS